MALGDAERARQLTRAAVSAHCDLSVDYVRAQEWYRDRAILDQLVDRLIAAGVPVGTGDPAAIGCAVAAPPAQSAS